MAGFREKLPTVEDALTPSVRFMGLFCMFGIVMIGLVCNLIAMKFYPLTKEKMEEVEQEVARIKAEKGVSAD